VSLPASVIEWYGSGRPEVPALFDHKVTGPKVCPSYPAELDGRPFAFRSSDGTLVFIGLTDMICSSDDTSVRYAGPCVTNRCVHWSGHCNLGAVMSHAAVTAVTVQPRRQATQGECGIVGSCRWFAENGLAACRACSDVDYLMSI
jgi:hypothetical protein